MKPCSKKVFEAVSPSRHTKNTFRLASAGRTNRLEVEHTTGDELCRKFERSVKRAVESRLEEVRRSMDRFVQKAYLQKTWLTLDEAAQYADITKATLRDWREGGLPEAKAQGRVYIKREALDRFIASHAEGE